MYEAVSYCMLIAGEAQESEESIRFREEGIRFREEVSATLSLLQAEVQLKASYTSSLRPHTLVA
jgi:hypothetical protein